MASPDRCGRLPPALPPNRTVRASMSQDKRGNRAARTSRLAPGVSTTTADAASVSRRRILRDSFLHEADAETFRRRWTALPPSG